MSGVVAIHQPNFFPWLGYFNKIARSDVFVLMDNVQFQKTGGTWLNRVRLLVNGQPAWVTIPIMRSYHGTRSIREMEINNSTSWRKKILNTLQMSYGRAPFFKEVFPLLEKLINYQTELLAEFNINAIRALVNALGIDIPKFVLGSTLEAGGNATDLLIEMVNTLAGSAYLSGDGAGGYQDDQKFQISGIELIYQNFQHPTYPQFRVSEFVPGLSIIDALMNCGFTSTQKLIGQVGSEG